MEEEEWNYCFIVMLLMRVALPTVRRYFIKRWNTVSKCGPWQNIPSNGNDLLTIFKFKPLPYEKNKVKSGDTTKWDLSLLVKALCHSKPQFFVTKKSKKISKKVKSLNCLKDARNTLCHTVNGKITTGNFNKLWADVRNALLLLGAASSDIEKVKQDVKDVPWNKLISLMKQCASQDDEILKVLQTIQSQLEHGQEEIKEVITEGNVMLKQVQSSSHVFSTEVKKQLERGHRERKAIKRKQDDLMGGLNKLQKLQHNPGSSSQTLLTEDIQQRSEYLKASIKRQTELQPKFMASHCIASAKTDDIFTNLLMQRGRKALPEGANREQCLYEYGNLSGTPVERCQDIFIAQGNTNQAPKSILVVGKAGIGKSMFCQKLVRDWAKDVLFQSLNGDHGFDFVYLLTFRHLNIINEEKLTLRDVLDRCSLLDEHSRVDESLFDNMVEHPERVLIILDGYDESAQRKSIAADSIEQNYKNTDLRVPMPVSALVSKLLQRKIFGEAVVMVTSRPDESKELGGMEFDAHVEIVGFSKKDVKEFICKYFNSNKKAKKNVLQHVMKNEDLLSLAHVPMFCFLLCWCMEWHVEHKPGQDLPITMTDLYYDCIDLFELKHYAKSEFRSMPIPEQCNCPTEITRIREKLSKLAAETMENKKLIFEEDDLTSCGLNVKEIEDLIASGLLTSGPGFRISATKITHHYWFLHLTLHEFLTALWYVQNEKVPPKKIESEMVFLFFAGVCRKTKCEKLMEQLFFLINSRNYKTYDAKLRFQLIHEYGDKEFGAEMMHKYPEVFCGICRTIFFEKSSKLLVFALDMLNYTMQRFPNENNFNTLRLDLWKDGHELVTESLKHPSSPITRLICDNSWFKAETEKVKYFLASLPSTKITHLEMMHFDKNYLLPSITNALIHEKCKITSLFLMPTIMDPLDHEIMTFDAKSPLPSITNALIHEKCKITSLTLEYDELSLLPHIKNALIHPNCKIRKLEFYTAGYSEANEAAVIRQFKHEVTSSNPNIKFTEDEIAI